MALWVSQGLEGQGGQQGQPGQQLRGQSGAANFQFVLRWLGGPARSGRRQILITMWDWPTCAEVFAITYRWWTRVPVEVDAQGWRMVPVRWMVHF